MNFIYKFYLSPFLKRVIISMVRLTVSSSSGKSSRCTQRAVASSVLSTISSSVPSRKEAEKERVGKAPGLAFIKLQVFDGDTRFFLYFS